MHFSQLDMLASAAGGASTQPGWVSFVPFIGMFAILWFFILRPQMNKQKEHQTKVAALKKGDQVLTGGGLVGKVLKVDEHYVELELGPNVKVKAVRSTIADVIPPPGTTHAND